MVKTFLDRKSSLVMVLSFEVTYERLSSPGFYPNKDVYEFLFVSLSVAEVVCRRGHYLMVGSKGLPRSFENGYHVASSDLFELSCSRVLKPIHKP